MKSSEIYRNLQKLGGGFKNKHKGNWGEVLIPETVLASEPGGRYSGGAKAPHAFAPPRAFAPPHIQIC